MCSQGLLCRYADLDEKWSDVSPDACIVLSMSMYIISRRWLIGREALQFPPADYLTNPSQSETQSN